MYKMGLLNGARTKSANIVGQTMRLNPHGDAAIYDTMVRLSKRLRVRCCTRSWTPRATSVRSTRATWRGRRAATPRQSSSAICAELFRDIDSDTVDFVDNYDNTMKEPALLPTTFPNVLVERQSWASPSAWRASICGFNLGEVCDTTIAYLKNPDCDLTGDAACARFPDRRRGHLRRRRSCAKFTARAAAA